MVKICKRFSVLEMINNKDDDTHNVLCRVVTYFWSGLSFLRRFGISYIFKNMSGFVLQRHYLTLVFMKRTHTVEFVIGVFSYDAKHTAAECFYTKQKVVCFLFLTRQEPPCVSSSWGTNALSIRGQIRNTSIIIMSNNGSFWINFWLYFQVSFWTE